MIQKFFEKKQFLKLFTAGKFLLIYYLHQKNSFEIHNEKFFVNLNLTLKRT